MTSADNRRKVVLLDGTPDNRESLAPVLAILRETLAAAGNEVRVFALRDMKLAHCRGCFGCWIKTPGICLQADAARDIAEAIVQAECSSCYARHLRRLLSRAQIDGGPVRATDASVLHHSPRRNAPSSPLSSNTTAGCRRVRASDR